ncbi:U6 snRNA phosphodiesterase Usb1 [Dipodascopsis uninucleata]
MFNSHKRSASPLEKPPPLPKKFYDLYASEPRRGDDPSLHNGRVRQVAHEKGLWPSHIYIEWVPTEQECIFLESLLPANTTSLLRSPLGNQLPLHISLSQNISVLTANRDSFVQNVIREIKKVFTEKFYVAFLKNRLSWISNTDRTRDFLVLEIADSNGKRLLEILSTSCDDICDNYSHPTLSSNQFHVSLAWKLGRAVSSQNSSLLNAVTNNHIDIGYLEACEIAKLKMPVDAIKIKIGRKVHSVDHKSS